MTAKQLKNSILQQAIQGKLINQNKEDEPASELLKRIKAEREKLIKSGKIKPNKNISAIYRKGNSFYEKIENEEICIDEELPFEIPKTWEWVYFKDIVYYSMGKTPPRKEKEYWENPKFAWISIADLVSNGFIYETKEKVNQYSVDKIFKNKISVAGTLLMSFKLTVGKVSILGIDAYHNEAIISIYPFINDENIMRDYLFFILPLISQYGNIKSAIKGNTLNSDSLDLLYIPLPPIEEQKRIVNKLNQLMPLIEEYEEKENKLNELDKKFPERLKKSILKEAAEGKLINQNKEDKPASELLKRIKAEREKLIKSGKIKINKNISAIYRKGNSFYEKIENEEICIDEELPFEIPKTWEWLRLGELCTIINGFTPLRTNPKFWENPTISWFTVNDIHSQGRRIKYTKQSINKCALSDNSSRILPAGTVLICCTASVGEYAITEIPLTTNQQFNGLIINEYYSKYYSSEFLFKIAPTFKAKLFDIAGKTTFNFISVQKLSNLLLPFPPIEEQKRIVEKLDKLINACEELKKILFI